MDCKKDIEDLIENIDEFKEKYVTYRTNTLRTILVKTLDHIKHKEQECAELKEYHNKCCQDFKKEKQDLINKYNQLSRNFYNGDYCNTEHCSLLKSKEQECKELETMVAAAEEAPICFHCSEELCIRQERDKYKQALDEIEEYCKKCNLKVDFTACDILGFINIVKDN